MQFRGNAPATRFLSIASSSAGSPCEISSSRYAAARRLVAAYCVRQRFLDRLQHGRLVGAEECHALVVLQAVALQDRGRGGLRTIDLPEKGDRAREIAIEGNEHAFQVRKVP